MLQNAGVLNILTCKCASRHSGVQFFDIKPPKSGPYPSVFPHFDLKCASRHSRVPFLNIGTSKIGPRLWCFVHFDLKMCFAPQPRAIFEHRNFQNGSANVVFCAFWLEHVLRATAACHISTSELPKWLRECGVFCILTWTVLRATAACHFSTSELPKWLRECGVLCILTCKCASRHSGVPFFTCLPEQLPPHPPL